MSYPFPNFNQPGHYRGQGPSAPVFQDPFIAAAAGVHQYQQAPQHNHPHHHHHHHAHHNCNMGACLSKPPAVPPKTYLRDPFDGYYGGGRELPTGWGDAGRPSEDSGTTSSTGATVGVGTAPTRPAFVPGMALPKAAGGTVRFNLPSESTQTQTPPQSQPNLPFTPDDPFPPRSPSAQSQPKYAHNLSFEPLDPYPPRSYPGGKKPAARDPLAGWVAQPGINREAAVRSQLEQMTSATAPWADERSLAFVKQLCAKPDTCAIVIEVFKSQINLGGIQGTKAVCLLPGLSVPALAQFVPELTKFIKDADEWIAGTAVALRDHAIAASAAVANDDEANFNAYLAAVGRAPQRSGGRQGYGHHFHGHRPPMTQMPGAYPWM